MAYKTRMSITKISEVLKFLIAVTLGFSIKLLIDMSSPKLECPQAVRCSQSGMEQELVSADLHTQLRERFKPNTMYEVIRYDFFNMSAILNNFDDDPKTGLLGHQKSDIKDIMHQAMALFNSARQNHWKLKRLLNGYRRVDALRGEEYVLDVEISATHDQKMVEQHRLELVKPFGVAHMIDDARISNDRMIHMILPISGVSQRFTSFLQNFEEVCLKGKQQIYLLIVLFLGKNGENEDAAEAVKTQAVDLTRRYRLAHIRVIQTTQAFSRALGMDLGAKQLPQDSLLFLCDVDVRFTSDFLTRCRLNAVHKKQVFYPIVFAQYDPAVVRGYSPKDKASNPLDINKYTGHWVFYGYGMACLYCEDYRVVGGFKLDIDGWGGEDVDLYTKHVRSHLSVFRAADPALVHIYHNKSCDPALPQAQYRMCINSMAESYGSRQQLGKMVLLKESDRLP